MQVFWIGGKLARLGPHVHGDRFVPLIEYPYPSEERTRTRGKPNAVAELVVDYSVPDIREVAVVVEHRKRDKLLERVWSVYDLTMGDASDIGIQVGSKVPVLRG